MLQEEVGGWVAGEEIRGRGRRKDVEENGGTEGGKVIKKRKRRKNTQTISDPHLRGWLQKYMSLDQENDFILQFVSD